MAIDTEERTSKTPKVAGDKKSGNSGNSNKKAITIVLAVIGVLIVLGLLSTLAAGFLFKKGAETIISTATDGKVKINSNDDDAEITIGGDDGEKIKMNTGSNTELPDGFPKSDVPVYPDAKIVSSMDMSSDEIKTFTVVLSTNDSISDVTSFYKKELSGGDWKNSYSSNSSDNSMLMFQNKSKKTTATIGVSRDNDDKETTISLSVRLGDDL